MQIPRRTLRVEEDFRMLTTTPCPDCIDLVGAHPGKEPHGALLQSAMAAAGAKEYCCTTCAHGWILRSAGWSALLDMP